MGIEYNKLCPYYEGVYDTVYERNTGYLRHVFRVQCNGLALSSREYKWSACNSYNHCNCPQYQFMAICVKYGKEKEK